MADDIFREVDEDLRRDRLERLWRRYGGLVVAGAVAVIALTAGYVGWDRWQTAQQIQRTAGLAAVVEPAQAVVLGEPGKTPSAPLGGAAAESLQAIATFAGAGEDRHALLARLFEAGLRARSGDVAGAVAVYEKLAAESRDDAVTRDLATVLLVLHQAGSGDPVALGQRLAPLLADSNPWRHTARELAALLALRQNDGPRARSLFQQLVDDAATPVALRARASDLLAQLPPS